MLRDNINKYYSTNKENFNKLIGQISNYSTKVYRDEEHNNIVDVISDNKPIIRATYEVIGYYNITTSIFVWAWANPFIEKDLIKKSSELRDLRNTFITTDKLDDETKQLYIYFVSNPSFYISGNNLSKLMPMILYYTEGNWILPRNNNVPAQLEFILIKNILQIK